MYRVEPATEPETKYGAALLWVKSLLLLKNTLFRQLLKTVMKTFFKERGQGGRCRDHCDGGLQ